MKNVIILGSGRSGTSMVANLFYECGYCLGDNYLGKNNSNPKGFFEDYSVNTVNENIISTVMCEIPENIRSVFFPKYPYYRSRWLARLKKGQNYKLDEKDKNIIKKLVSQKLFCYKDPRFSYTLPIWEPMLPKHTNYICVFREPQNTALSIVKECKSSQALEPLKMNFKTALKTWYRMYDNILDIYRKNTKMDHWIFMHYNQILDNTGIEKIERIFEIVINKSIPEQKINRTKINMNLPESYTILYNKLCKLANYE